MLGVVKIKKISLLFANSFLLIFVILLIFVSGTVRALTCGGDWPCSCGDTLIESYTLYYDLLDCPHPSDGIIVGVDNVTFDCDGHMITSISGGTGIYLEGRNNVTIQNCVIDGFYDAIELVNSDNNTLLNNNLTARWDYGMNIYSSSDNNLVEGNVIAGNPYEGLFISNSVGNVIWKNYFISNSGSNALEWNDATGNFWNLSEIGNHWDDFENNPGYPTYYEIFGPGDGMDYWPNNDAPVLDSIGSQIVDEVETLIIDLHASDPEDNTLTYSTDADSVLPGSFDFDSVSGLFEWTPTYDDSGDYIVRFSVSDNEFEDYEEVTITVNNVNRAPILDFIEDININETQQAVIIANASDPDGDNLSYSINYDYSDTPRFIHVNNTFTWQTNYYDAGVYTVIISVSDGNLSDEQNITVTVNNVPIPDFSINNSDIFFSDSAPEGGEEVYITALFYNIADTHPGDILVYFYDGPPQSGGILIGEYIVLPSLILEDSYVAQIPWNAVFGNHSIYVFVDPLNTIFELNESNNVAFRNISVSSSSGGEDLPDLEIDENDIFFSNPNPQENEQITVFASIRNIGVLDSEEFMVQFYYDNPDNIISEQNVSLEVNETQVLTVNWNALIGTHTIYVNVDPFNVIHESNEQNNVASRAITSSGCGDGICNNNENCNSCEVDCGCSNSYICTNYMSSDINDYMCVGVVEGFFTPVKPNLSDRTRLFEESINNTDWGP